MMNDIESLFVGENERFGLDVVHKDGKVDSYDPIESGGITENETEYLIDNGYSSLYREPKDNVAELRRYELCQKCNYPIERCHCSEVSNGTD